MSLVLSLPALAQAQKTAPSRFVQALDRMMVELARESRRDAKLIQQIYRQHLDLLVLEQYGDLEVALSNGGLAPLPGDPLKFNLAPRLDGPSPIGEKDLANQISYLAARPATIGSLLEIASRVKSGPVEVTSLVRHTAYQGALRATNKNATTSVPMHTMGLAFDIALVNVSLETAYEIRDVLRRMRDAGDILFIGERKQLVFHVVPHPSRLGHFTNVYTQSFGRRPATNDPRVVAFSSSGDAERARPAPLVTAEVIAVAPTTEFAAEWWTADHAHADLTIEVAPLAIAEEVVETQPAPPANQDVELALTLLGGFAAMVFRFRGGQPAVGGLFTRATSIDDSQPAI